jgi:hypothetical protein
MEDGEGCQPVDVVAADTTNPPSVQEDDNNNNNSNSNSNSNNNNNNNNTNNNISHSWISCCRCCQWWKFQGVAKAKGFSYVSCVVLCLFDFLMEKREKKSGQVDSWTLLFCFHRVMRKEPLHMDISICYGTLCFFNTNDSWRTGGK